MDQAVSSIGDPLFGTWVVAWDVHKLLELDFDGLFDANIFYPYKDTLAYTEHTIGSTIFALPLIAILKNPVLGYNVALLMGMALSGFGMFLLASYLTGNRFAAFCAGLIYAFFPWRFVHIIQITLQQTQWIPLTFLYLHKFFACLPFSSYFNFSRANPMVCSLPSLRGCLSDWSFIATVFQISALFTSSDYSFLSLLSALGRFSTLI
jgi:hypothetical protein